ncbi:hypothetical protein ACS0TY_025275 [Phlomoides rotata]
MFPRLFYIDNNPSCSVADRYLSEGTNRIFCGNWRRNLRSWETDLLSVLLRAAEAQLNPTSSEDTWRWRRNSSGIFTVKSAYEAIVESHAGEIIAAAKLGTVWIKAVPLKIAAFSWKVLQDRIPTIMNLLKREAYNKNFSPKCRLCDLENEDTNHLFFECFAAKNIWYHIYRWVGFDRRITTTGMDHLEDFINHLDNYAKGIGNSIWQCTIWNIWNRRNAVIFKGITISDDEVFERICLNTYAWLRNKNIISSVIGIADWLREPGYCIA